MKRILIHAEGESILRILSFLAEINVDFSVKSSGTESVQILPAKELEEKVTYKPGIVRKRMPGVQRHGVTGSDRLATWLSTQPDFFASYQAIEDWAVEIGYAATSASSLISDRRPTQFDHNRFMRERLGVRMRSDAKFPAPEDFQPKVEPKVDEPEEQIYEGLAETILEPEKTTPTIVDKPKTKVELMIELISSQPGKRMKLAEVDAALTKAGYKNSFNGNFRTEAKKKGVTLGTSNGFWVVNPKEKPRPGTAKGGARTVYTVNGKSKELNVIDFLNSMPEKKASFNVMQDQLVKWGYNPNSAHTLSGKGFYRQDNFFHLGTKGV